MSLSRPKTQNFDFCAAAKRKEKEKKERQKKIRKIKKPKDVGLFLVQKLKILISVHGQVKIWHHLSSTSAGGKDLSNDARSE